MQVSAAVMNKYRFLSIRC